MAELKTRPTTGIVQKFLRGIPDEARRQDCLTVLKIRERATGEKPRMWGASIVGLGTYHYRYESGREGDWFLTGFSPRKESLTLCLMGGLGRHAALLRKLGKHKTSKGCLHIKRLSDVELPVLTELIQSAVADLKRSRA